MKLTSKQQLLLEFVKTHHGDQVRKYTGEPYWHHVLSVAEIVDNKDLIEIALCHDLLEDTKCDESDLLNELLSLKYEVNHAIWILQGVVDLTDVYTKEAFPTLNRKGRKKKEAERLGNIRAISQTVKYADLIDNTKSITEHDPVFAKTYLREKTEILKKMRGGDAVLFHKCVVQIIELSN